MLETLRQQGIEDQTLVFFSSDNGGPTPQTTSRNDPLRGFKAQVFEGGIRVPFMVQWKGRLPAGQVYREMVMGFDVHATALAAAGVVSSSLARPIDGVDLMPYLLGQRDGAPHSELFWRGGASHAARVGNYKLVRSRARLSADGEGDAPDSASDRPATDQLFDLATDIEEQHDLAASRPEVLQRLRDAYSRWDAAMMAPRWIRQDASNAEVGGKLKASGGPD